MIKLHFAILWAGRMQMLAMMFCILMLCIAMSFAGWLGTLADFQNAGWICLLVFLTATIQVEMHHEGKRMAVFIAQKKLHRYLAGKFWAILSITVGFAALWSTLLACIFGIGFHVLMQMLAMSLFCVIACHAMIVDLDPQIATLKSSQRHLLMLVIPVPWILPAWLLGLFACGSMHSDQWQLLPILALTALGLVQFALGSLFRVRTPNGIKKNADPQQNQP